MVEKKMGRIRNFDGRKKNPRITPARMTKVSNSSEIPSANPKEKYLVTNWSVYNKALVNRGDITLYFAEDAIESWYSDLPLQKGAQELYSDVCIETIMMLKVVFKLAYRQAQGFTQGLLKLMRLDELKVPSYTQINRRVRALHVESYAIPCSGSITIAIDSTGVKVFGEGEWKVRQHGWSKRRSWRKLHLGVDPKTGFVHCHVLTQNNESDDAQLPQLLEQIKPPVEEACFDGAYDTEKCWDKLISQGTKPIIPPQKNAVPWYWEQPGDLPDYPRNIAIARIDEIGRAAWKKEIGYHKRSLAETTMYRYKTMLGNTFFSRTLLTQKVECSLKIKALNQMTAIGMPISKPRKATA
jgi:hypothetical protein